MRKLLIEYELEVIDTDIPKLGMSRIWQSIGFRYKIGPLIRTVNNYVKERLKYQKYDLIWVDKAIYLTPETTSLFKSLTSCLVHFTPDPAFTFHKSKLFYASLKFYDFVVTTKSFEIASYKTQLGNNRVLYATQGYDAALHRPLCQDRAKSGICFLGHYEKERADLIDLLLKAGISVKLAGIKWENFVKDHKSDKKLIYLGAGVYGEDYVKTISSSLMSLGSISKWIPEKHTTRTFEIPACGTALLTERNEELSFFFDEDEAIFYSSKEEMLSKVIYYMDHPKELLSLTKKGRQRVIKDGRDYESIIKGILKQINIL